MAMQWDPQAVRAALAAPGEKTSRRLLSELCEDFRREKPEEWKRIEAASYSEPDCAAAQRAYRRASAVSTTLLVLALAVVIAAFVLGDFGAAFLTGWGNRYLLAGAVLAAMGLLVLGGLFAGKYRAIFLATVLLAREESETDN